MDKLMELKPNSMNDGIDLLIERDTGNPVLILMGKRDIAIKRWDRLRRLANKAYLELVQYDPNL